MWRILRNASPLLLVLILRSQTTAVTQYRVDTWSTSDGLPQRSVFSIIQTRDGYLWLSTFDGLVRFDGVRFTVFDKSNIKDSLLTASLRFMKTRTEHFGQAPVTVV